VFGAENAKWIHQNTTYSRILKLKTKEDFKFLEEYNLLLNRVVLLKKSLLQ